jgi:outer membrane lipopolysaccharide assembly protein LptE/RlpB
MRLSLLRLVLLLLLPLGLGGCAVDFNFTGTGSVDTELETLSVANFNNEAQIVVSYLAQEVTNQLQDRFLNQSRLTLTSGAADIELGGSITRYAIQPVAIQGGDQAAQSRLTIAVRVVYENNVNPKDSWENTFTSFVDFDADLNFSSEEARLIDEVLEQITQDVFTKSIGKW